LTPCAPRGFQHATSARCCHPEKRHEPAAGHHVLKHQFNIDDTQFGSLGPERISGRLQPLPFAFDRAAFIPVLHGRAGPVHCDLHADHSSGYAHVEIRRLTALRLLIRAQAERGQHRVERLAFRFLVRCCHGIAVFAVLRLILPIVPFTTWRVSSRFFRGDAQSACKCFIPALLCLSRFLLRLLTAHHVLPSPRPGRGPTW